MVVVFMTLHLSFFCLSAPTTSPSVAATSSHAPNHELKEEPAILPETPSDARI
jgi:hypothetical protein